MNNWTYYIDFLIDHLFITHTSTHSQCEVKWQNMVSKFPGIVEQSHIDMSGEDWKDFVAKFIRDVWEDMDEARVEKKYFQNTMAEMQKSIDFSLTQMKAAWDELKPLKESMGDLSKEVKKVRCIL